MPNVSIGAISKYVGVGLEEGDELLSKLVGHQHPYLRGLLGAIAELDFLSHLDQLSLVFQLFLRS